MMKRLDQKQEEVDKDFINRQRNRLEDGKVGCCFGNKGIVSSFSCKILLLRLSKKREGEKILQKRREGIKRINLLLFVVDERLLLVVVDSLL